MVDLYHKAARDGILEILKTASKRDSNRRDEDFMTPVHYAASCGNVEALRLLVGKGGDPDKTNADGSTAVHLAAGCGQLNCLSFLTNFGANIWALDNEGHTPLEEAAVHGRMDCVRHLDGLVAIQTLRNKKATERLQRHAKREAIKRMKKQSKAQEERDKAYERRIRKESREGPTPAISVDNVDGPQSGKILNASSEYSWDVQSARSGMTNGTHNGSSHNGYRFSELAGISSSEDNISSEIDDRSMRSHPYSDSMVAKSRFLGMLKSKIGTLGKKSSSGSTNSNGNVILQRTHSKSEPNIMKKSQGEASTSSGIGRYTDEPVMLYNRPITNNKGPLSEPESDEDDSDDDETKSIGHIMKKYDDKGNVTTEIQYVKKERRVNGSVTSRRSSRQSYTTNNDIVSLQSAGFGFDDFNSETLTESTEMKAVVTFLAALNLEQFASPFLKESIDLSALLLCDDKDLHSIGLPLGPRRKILEAIKRRNVALRFPGAMNDSKI